MGYKDVNFLKSKGILIETVPREELNFKKLLAKRIEIVPASFIVGYTMIKKLFTSQEAALFTHHPKTLFNEDMFLLVSRNIPNGQALCDTFDKGLKKLKKSGRYDEIMSNFLKK